MLSHLKDLVYFALRNLFHSIKLLFSAKQKRIDEIRWLISRYLGDLIFIILGKILNFSLQNIQNE